MNNKEAAWLSLGLIGIGACILLTGFLSCTLPQSAGGATDTESGGVIAGVVIDSGGKAAAGVTVTLVPASYNPGRDAPLADSDTVITDENGAYAFCGDKGVRYNIHAERPADGVRFLRRDVMPGTGGTPDDTGVLARPGYLMVVLADTFDRENGYIYFRGTQWWSDLKKASVLGGGGMSVSFSALPSARMPELVYARLDPGGAESVVAPSVRILASDSLVLETRFAATKPLWKFSLCVGVRDSVSRRFGGIGPTTARIAAQLNKASNSFNAASCFDGVILFIADSVYEYSGNLSAEGAPASGRFDYSLIYDETAQQVVRNKIVRYSTIYLWDPQPDTLFGDRYTAYLARLLGELRGALNLSWIAVDSARNPVNAEAFPDIPSIMGSPLKYATWDDYSVSIINHNAGSVGFERDIVTAAFPDTLGVSVTAAGEGAAAEITVYGSLLNSRSVGAAPLFSGTADRNGRFVFPHNPFFADSTKRIIYGNLLIIATLLGDTASAWLPLCEAGNSYFRNPAAAFYGEIRF